MTTSAQIYYRSLTTADHYIAFDEGYRPYLVGGVWYPVHAKRNDSEGFFFSHLFHFEPRKQFIGRRYPAIEVFQSMNIWFHME